MGLIRRIVAMIALVAVASCASGKTSIGPLTLDVPKGWLVTDREPNSLKLTDGTIADADATQPGTAKAVFDIYTESTQTTQTFERYLREQRIKPSQTRSRIDGYEAETYSYGAPSAGGRQEAVFIPRWRVFILYRAAFPSDDAAFFRGRGAFRAAVASISFEGKPSSASGSVRHGPTRGKSTVTAMTDPIAIIMKPS
jgi:hypothetical protein